MLRSRGRSRAPRARVAEGPEASCSRARTAARARSTSLSTGASASSDAQARSRSPRAASRRASTVLSVGTRKLASPRPESPTTFRSRLSARSAPPAPCVASSSAPISAAATAPPASPERRAATLARSTFAAASSGSSHWSCAQARARCPAIVSTHGAAPMRSASADRLARRTRSPAGDGRAPPRAARAGRARPSSVESSRSSCACSWARSRTRSARVEVAEHDERRAEMRAGHGTLRVAPPEGVGACRGARRPRSASRVARRLPRVAAPPRDRGVAAYGSERRQGAAASSPSPLEQRGPRSQGLRLAPPALQEVERRREARASRTSAARPATRARGRSGARPGRPAGGELPPRRRRRSRRQVPRPRPRPRARARRTSRPARSTTRPRAR